MGKARDHTAIAVVQRVESMTHTVGAWGNWKELEYAPAKLIHLEKLRLGTPFVEAVARVAEVARDAGRAPGGKRLVVDATGLGSPVVEMLREARTGYEMRPVTITGGAGQTRTLSGWNVAKRDLMTGLRTSMETQDLLIAARLQEAKALRKELAEFGGTGHDDLVMALALGVWGVRLRPAGMRANGAFL